MNKKQTDALTNLLNIISDISSKNYQKRVWIEGKGPECDAFDDTVCDFFGIGDYVISQHQNFNMSEEQYLLIKSFSKQFRHFTDSVGLVHFPIDFIDSPEWTKITEMAKAVLKAFHWEAS